MSVWSLTTVIGTESEEEAASIHAASDDSGRSPATLPAKKRRRMNDRSLDMATSRKRGQKKLIVRVPKNWSCMTVISATKNGQRCRQKPLAQECLRVKGTSAAKLHSRMKALWHHLRTLQNSYGQSFRNMTSEEQKTEVLRLNKGAASGRKGAIKKQRIHSQFKDLVSEKMKEYVIQNRTQQTNMFRSITTSRVLQNLQLNRISVGERIERSIKLAPRVTTHSLLGKSVQSHVPRTWSPNWLDDVRPSLGERLKRLVRTRSAGVRR